jgi:hypothetical protein
MKSGTPGGTISERGSMRVTGSPGSPSSSYILYATEFWKPLKGSPSTVMRVSHLTFCIPYQPGTTRRRGNPCCGGRGSPFMS